MVYIHKEDTHNLNAPRQIVPIVNALVRPKSVVDFGCGVGTFLYAFKEIGVPEVLGIDGKWANTDLLKRYLTANEFADGNLAEFIDVKKKFDLAICLEVAEHIEEKSADNLIKSLVTASDLILFSAAIPFQLGQYHVNEQWPLYWKEKFAKHGFLLIDSIRMNFWNIEALEFWYKQNMLFAVRKTSSTNYPFLFKSHVESLSNLVHPALYLEKALLLDSIENGRKPVIFYLKLLIKTIFIRFKILKR